MRQVRLLFSSLLISGSALAGTNEYYFEGNFSRQKISRSSILNYNYRTSKPPEDYNTNLSTQTFGYRGVDTFENISLNGSLSFYQLDYTTTKVVPTKTMNVDDEYILSDKYSGNEIVGQVGAEYTRGKYAVNLGLSSNLSPSPYPTQTVTLGGRASFYDLSTIISGTHTLLWRKQPESWSGSKSAHNRQPQAGTPFMGPTSVLGNETVLNVTQILSERIKVFMQGSTGQLKEVRPRYMGLDGKAGFAIWERVSFVAGGKYLHELRSGHPEKDLSDDYGYYDLVGWSSEINFEPTYTTVLSIGLSSIVEIENDPREKIKNTIGSDALSAGAHFQDGEYTYQVKASYGFTSTKSNDYAIFGGISWKR